MDVIDAVATRVAVNRAKSRLTSRFAGAVSPVSGTVIGEGLALVNGQLVNAAVSESQIGETLSLQNAGRAAAAVYVPTAGAGGVASASSGGGGVVSVPSGGLIAHDLGGSFHIGQLRSDQAAWALMVDGSRMLMGDLDVYAGVLIDGVDLDVHAADPAAHHDPVTVGYGLERLGQQVSLSPSVAGGGLTYNAGVISVGAGYGIQVNGDDVQLAPSVAGAGLAYDAGVLSVNVAGLGMGVANDAVRLTSSSNPGASAAVLASDASGWTTLVGLVASERARTPIVDTASGALTLSPAMDLILSPASNLVKLPSGKMLQSDGYQSQAQGMRITAGGSGDFRYLYADELHAKSFIADLEQALAGGQIVSKSVAVVAETFTLPAGGGAVTVRFKDLPSAPNMAVFQSGDWVAFRSFSRAGGSLTIGWAWGQVTNYVDGTGGNEGTQTWTWTRNAGTPGAATGDIAADALALDFGVSGNGYYEVNAIDGQYAENSPYWRIVTWSSHPATQTVRVQGGNLKGLFGQANEYGFYAGDGVTTASKYLRLSSAANEFRNLTASWYKAGTMVAQVTPNEGFRLQRGGGYPIAEEYTVSWYSNLAAGTGKTWSIGTYSDATDDWMTIESAVSDSRRKVLRLNAANAVGGAVIDLSANPSPQGNGSISLWAPTSINFQAAAVTIGTNSYTIWHAGNDGHNSTLDADRLDGNEGSYYLAASSYTAADVLAKIKTVDGSSSGLDADTIDTVDSSRIVYGQASTASTQKTDINWNAKSGFYSKTPGSSGGGAPSDTYYHVIESTYYGDSYYMMQIAQYMWGDELYHRIATNSSGNKSFGTWRRIADDVALSGGAFVDAYFTGHIAAGNTGLTNAGSVSATNWFRSIGSTGWYSHTYGGGIHMTDSTWVRTYNGKGFYCSSTIQSEALLVNQNVGALGSWVNASLGTGWANYGGGYVSARYRRFGDVVQVHGMVYCTNAGYGGIFNIPYQIAARYIYEPASSVQHQRVDVVPGSGYSSIQTVGGQTLNQWIMLDMIIPIY